jgi:CRISPR-associated protein Cmr5
MTRAQKDLVLAEELVSSLPEDRELRDIYGGLCHSFPVLVRTCGLCQALAFHTAEGP